MNKLIRDGKVAVLYSPGYSAGWSTWAEPHEKELLMYDADIVQLVLDVNAGSITAEEFYAKVDMIWQLKSYESDLNTQNLHIRWLPEGSLFRVEEYNGSERVIMQHEYKWHVA